MRYGDWQAKLAFLEPVFDRLAFLHGRLGNSCCMHVALDDPSVERAVADVREMPTRSIVGFLSSAGPGDLLGFDSEILHRGINYARRCRTPDGEWREERPLGRGALSLRILARLTAWWHPTCGDRTTIGFFAEATGGIHQVLFVQPLPRSAGAAEDLLARRAVVGRIVGKNRRQAIIPGSITRGFRWRSPQIDGS